MITKMIVEGVRVLNLMLKVQYLGVPDTLQTMRIDEEMETQGAPISINHKEILDVFAIEIGDKAWYGLQQQMPDEGTENEYMVLSTENYLKYTETGTMVEIDLENG